MSQSTTTKQNPKRLPTECKICGAHALYSYFGVVVCSSCQIFFRRNAKAKQDHFKCHYEGHCEVNINNRHICGCCRLAKCFASGMQVEMIRASRSAKINKNKKSQPLILEEKQSKNLNLLQSDQSQAFKSAERSIHAPSGKLPDPSILSIDEWSLLSNINHYYNESNGCLSAQRYIREQNELPPKMRFKMESIVQFFTIITNTGRVLYEKNLDFISLCSHDRSFLIHKTMKHVISLSTSFILHCSPFIDYTTLYKSAEIIYGSSTLASSYRAIEQLDFDIILVKLLLTLLTFSTFDSINYTNVVSNNLLNIKLIIRFQDKYTKLIWRYLLHQYSHERAVIYFSNLIRYLFSLNDALSDGIECKKYTNMIDLLIKQTEETLAITL